MLPSIQQFSKIVNNFFRVGVWAEWFVQVFLYTPFLVSDYINVVRVGDPRRGGECQVI